MPAEGPLTPHQIVDRLVDAMVNEAALALEERVVSRPDDVDLATVLGTGFQPFRGGLLRYADTAGIGAIVERLARRQQEGAPSGPAGKLQQMALSRGSVYKKWQPSGRGAPPDPGHATFPPACASPPPTPPSRVPPPALP